MVGYQHRIGDREGVLEYFNKVIVEGCVIEEIPLEHKNKLEIYRLIDCVEYSEQYEFITKLKYENQNDLQVHDKDRSSSKTSD